MKNKFLLSLGLVASVVCGSNAQAFPVYAQAVVNPFQVAGQLTNTGIQPLFCSIRVQGLRNDGISQWAFSNVAVYPGMSGFAYAYTSAPFIFVNGQAFADCRIIGPYGLTAEEVSALENQHSVAVAEESELLPNRF